MEEKQRYTVPKGERLKSRKAIEQLFSGGKSFSNFPFRVLWTCKTGPPPYLKAGFTVSSRYFKKAVDRNRIKRVMREAWRLQKNELGTILEKKQKPLVVFLIYQGNALPEYRQVYEKTGTVIKRLIKLTDENSMADT